MTVSVMVSTDVPPVTPTQRPRREATLTPCAKRPNTSGKAAPGHRQV
ncbi:MAG: hypothetical protein J0H02_15950 [Armatimonadetes bacterium]|nr:hypothetical protein [Armatimonadota bacterium]